MERNISSHVGGVKSVFPQRLRKLIESAGMSQTSLAAMVGVTRQTMNFYTLGRSAPNFETLIKIANVFEVSTDYLVGNENDSTLTFHLADFSHYTGLTNQTINNLNSFIGSDTREPADVREVYAETVNALLGTNDLFDAIKSLKLSERNLIDCLKNTSDEDYYSCFSESFYGISKINPNVEPLIRAFLDYKTRLMLLEQLINDTVEYWLTVTDAKAALDKRFDLRRLNLLCNEFLMSDEKI